MNRAKQGAELWVKADAPTVLRRRKVTLVRPVPNGINACWEVVTRGGMTGRVIDEWLTATQPPAPTPAKKTRQDGYDD